MRNVAEHFCLRHLLHMYCARVIKKIIIYPAEREYTVSHVNPCVGSTTECLLSLSARPIQPFLTTLRKHEQTKSYINRCSNKNRGWQAVRQIFIRKMRAALRSKMSASRPMFFYLCKSFWFQKCSKINMTFYSRFIHKTMAARRFWQRIREMNYRGLNQTWNPLEFRALDEGFKPNPKIFRVSEGNKTRIETRSVFKRMTNQSQI